MESLQNAALELDVIYQDEQIVVVNKPAGVVVNKAKTVEGPTIQDWLVDFLGGGEELKKIAQSKKEWQSLVPDDFDDQYGSPAEIFLKRQGLVHRLDKDTSGVLLLAKNPGALVNLLRQFKQRTTKKKYLCLVHGEAKVDSAAIRAPIARSSLNRHKFRAEIDGRQSVTYYRVIQTYTELKQEAMTPQQQKQLKDYWNSYQQGFSLLEVMPKTGRTHQVRVHMAHIKHPLVADRTYGGSRRSRLDQIWCPRQFLHALQIQTKHPLSQKKVVYSADLAKDLKPVIQLLQT